MRNQPLSALFRRPAVWRISGHSPASQGLAHLVPTCEALAWGKVFAQCRAGPGRPNLRPDTVMPHTPQAFHEVSGNGSLQRMRVGSAGRAGQERRRSWRDFRPVASIWANDTPAGCLMISTNGVSGGLTASRHALNMLSIIRSASGSPTTRPASHLLTPINTRPPAVLANATRPSMTVRLVLLLVFNVFALPSCQPVSNSRYVHCLHLTGIENCLSWHNRASKLPERVLVTLGL